MKRSRGRPRGYDADTALEAAGHVFWSKGFSATSLDDLSTAMSMNRPSIYRAFGDKETIYRKAMAQFCVRMEEAIESTMFAEDDLRKALTRFYREALAIYTSGEQPKGCMVMSTAVSAAGSHPEIQADLLNVIRTIDRKIKTRLQQAMEAGRLPADFDASTRAGIAQALLHSLSLRARAGETTRRLENLIKSGVEAVVSA